MGTSRGGVECHFLLIDLDDFKRVNDRHGWEWGDRLLEAVAEALADTFRGSDFVARVGGDEFLVLLPATRLAAALELARRVRTALGKVEIDTGASVLRCRASLGVARLPESARNVSEAIAVVGGAVRRSKKRGKDAISVDAATSLDVPSVSVSMASGDMPLNIEGDPVLAQPIGRISDAAVAGWWVRSSGPVVSMSGISTGHSGPINLVDDDIEALRRAARAAHQLPGSAPLWFCVMPDTLLSAQPSELVEALGVEGSQRRVGLLLADHDIVGDPASLAEAMAALRDLGIGGALRSVSFSRATLETLVLLRPELVGIGTERLYGDAPDPARLREAKRMLRVVQSLGALPFVDGVAGPNEAALAQALGVELGVGAALGELFVLSMGD